MSVVLPENANDIVGLIDSLDGDENRLTPEQVSRIREILHVDDSRPVSEYRAVEIPNHVIERLISQVVTAGRMTVFVIIQTKEAYATATPEQRRRLMEGLDPYLNDYIRHEIAGRSVP
jgi:hypothetical protein